MAGFVNMEYYVYISESETLNPSEVPVEMDGGESLSMIQSQFSSAVGLKFRDPTNRTLSTVSLAAGVSYPPKVDGEPKYIWLTLQQFSQVRCVNVYLNNHLILNGAQN